MTLSTPHREAEWRASSTFSGSHAAYVEMLYEAYLDDPQTVSPEWRKLFDQLPGETEGDVSHTAIQEALRAWVTAPPSQAVASVEDQYAMGIQALIASYRLHGHALSRLDPLNLVVKPTVAPLSLEYHGLHHVASDHVVEVGDFGDGAPRSLGQLCQQLNRTYCGSVGVEFQHLVSDIERQWVQERLERAQGHYHYEPVVRQRILERLIAAEGLEKYLGSRYPGAKRFSLEGCDALIVAMDQLIHQSTQRGVKDINIGMAHRGRLNVLVNCMGKKPADLFAEFEGRYAPDIESGDVKYHQGFSSDIETPHGCAHLNLAFNPSHLEIVTPVVMGAVKARQVKRQDEQKKQVMPIAIHGDASFAGQGVVMEVLNMSQTRGYGVGGTIHVIVNNQVGFTTSHPEDARSTLYCSDVAKMIQSPVFHVNADDPEAVSFVARLAFDYRATFKKDVVIDLVGYRRHGHNEADEPAATQPRMYQVIKQHPTVCQRYGELLIQEGILDQAGYEALLTQYRQALEAGRCVALEVISHDKIVQPLFAWQPYLKQNWRADYEGRESLNALKQLGQRMINLPEGLSVHSRVAKVYQDRRAMYAGETALDWGAAETLAYATLLARGHAVRLSGQDCGRGTFAHRHSVIHDQDTAERYIPLNHCAEQQGAFTVIDSLLSEEAVLAYEYGFSSTDPNSLVIWEAQFGDFANGAQVVIDQFISSGETKWGRLCGLVMLLPHGYEGMGPEHSSARLERFMQLCAQHNIQVCVPSTPAQIYHLLRRQIIRPLRKPLVVMSPKSLLRHRMAISTLEELAEGTFELMIDDHSIRDPESVERIVISSGKVYYDLLEGRRDMKREGQVALVRLEQIYPFPEAELKALLARYPKAREIVWCQEEPQNQGAWYASRHHFESCLSPEHRLRYAGRAASASPAVGYPSLHQQQQNELVYDALN